MKLETRLFLTDLTHLDCAWFDPQDGLVGETWRVDVELGGELADNGMLCDFGVVKQVLKQALDQDVDHRLLLTAAQARQLDQQSAQAQIVLHTDDGHRLRYQAPQQAFALLDIDNLQAPDLALHLAQQLRPLLPNNVQHLKLQLTPAHEQGPYRYCHGLRQHGGNCQRMAHGHRARLEIRLDGQRSAALEQQWQQRFDGRYIGSAEDLIRSGDSHCYAYTGSQGRFELELPASRSCVIEAEPTIEHICAHMAGEIAREHSGQSVACRAFEGIGKGAISQYTPD